MGREVAILRRIPVLVKATANCHDFPRTVLLASVLKRVNCVREPADEGCVDHCGCPYLAAANITGSKFDANNPSAGTVLFNWRATGYF
jgi:hypothetical protein